MEKGNLKWHGHMIMMDKELGENYLKLNLRGKGGEGREKNSKYIEDITRDRIKSTQENET